MTLELKKKYVLINVFQYTYKHLFNNTQCKIHNKHISYHCSHYYASGSLRRILGCTKQTNGL